jgi:hypothetical protein
MQQQKLGYPFSYGDELTPEMAQSNRNKMLIILLWIWLIVDQVQAVPLPGADGFAVSPNNPRCRKNPNQCRNYGIFSRTATSAGTHLNNNANDAHFEPSLNSTFEKKQLQKKFEHAKEFGVLGNYNVANRDLFQRKLIEHMKSTHACLGTYRGHEVYYYYNPETNLNVMVNRNNNKFISGWRLSPDQITNMEHNGNIQ